MIATNRRRTMGKIGLPADTIMTTETNPEVLAICYAKGWAKHADYMTAREAAAVTNISNAFFRITSITHFEEFKYFTGITSLVNSNFNGSTNLVNIILPNTITTIGSSVFQGCSKLKSIELPSGLTSIGATCFYQCPKLLTITSHATTAPTITTTTFINMSKYGTLYVPTGSNYSTWMSTGDNYLGKYNWTKVEQ